MSAEPRCLCPPVLSSDTFPNIFHTNISPFVKLRIQFIILFSETQGKAQKRCDLDNEITPFSNLISVMAVAVVTAGGNAVLLRVTASCRMTTVVMICFHAI